MEFNLHSGEDIADKSLQNPSEEEFHDTALRMSCKSIVLASMGQGGNFLVDLICKARGREDVSYISDVYNEYSLKQERNINKFFWNPERNRFEGNDPNAWKYDESFLDWLPVPLHIYKEIKTLNQVKEIWYVDARNSKRWDYIKDLWFIKRRCGHSVVPPDFSHNPPELETSDIQKLHEWTDYCKWLQSVSDFIFPNSTAGLWFFYSGLSWNEHELRNWFPQFYKTIMNAPYAQGNFNPVNYKNDYWDVRSFANHYSVELKRIDYDDFFHNLNPSGYEIDSFLESRVKPYTERNNELLEKLRSYIY